MAELARYKCTGCQWIYDPRFGDAANEVLAASPLRNYPPLYLRSLRLHQRKFAKVEETPVKKEAPKKRNKNIMITPSTGCIIY